MSSQSVIVPLALPHARFLTMRFAPNSQVTLKTAIEALQQCADQLQQQYPHLHIKTGVAFGLQMWQSLHPRTPTAWHNLAPRHGDFDMPAIDADVFLHLSCEQPDITFALAKAFLDACQSEVEVLNETACFRYLDSRDFTGFIDGTENPKQADERQEAALLGEDSGEFADGSFVMQQRYVHHLPLWNQQSTQEQERIIGRSKHDSVELDEDNLPENAHIARVIIEDEAGEELAILRHSLPYGLASGEHGLYFVAYTPNLNILDQMLDNMFGTAGDGLHDQFLHYTTAVDGAYLFMPSQQLLQQIVAS